MAKRSFLQLCHTFKSQEIGGWYISEKLEGQRCFWDGGISRGIPTAKIPYANTVKDSRLVDEPIATGLWSRMAKVIRAPDWWINQLPPIPLDGELYLGPKRDQEMATIIRSHSGTDWSDIRYMILDSPPLETIFEDGQIEIRMGNIKYYLYFNKVMDWVRQQGPIETVKPGTSFYAVYNWLKKQMDIWPKGVAWLHHQEQLPVQPLKIQIIIDELMESILAKGGEGIVVRSHVAPWMPERVHSCLKMKPEEDSEGLVTGYTWGKEGKFLGMMGNLILDWNGTRLELSGFTDIQREMSVIDSIHSSEGLRNPGIRISENWTNKTFPIGSVITFKYRDVTRDGVPKEARYYRKREIE